MATYRRGKQLFEATMKTSDVVWLDEVDRWPFPRDSGGGKERERGGRELSFYICIYLFNPVICVVTDDVLLL